MSSGRKPPRFPDTTSSSPGIALPGTIEGQDFSFGDSSGEFYEGFKGRALLFHTSSTTLDGSFTADQGVDGTVRVERVTTVENCDHSGEGHVAKVVPCASTPTRNAHRPGGGY